MASASARNPSVVPGFMGRLAEWRCRVNRIPGRGQADIDFWRVLGIVIAPGNSMARRIASRMQAEHSTLPNVADSIKP